MTLQRNQSNRKRAVSGFLCLVLGVALLQGCKANPNMANTAATEETTITEATTELIEPATIETEPTTIVTEPDKIVLERLSPEEQEKAIEELKIVPNDQKYEWGHFFTLMFTNAEGNDKVMLVTLSGKGNVFFVSDAFTKTELFHYSSNEEKLSDNLWKDNIDIYNEIDYFVGATNVCTDFATDFVNFVTLMDNVEYDESFIDYYIPREFRSYEYFVTLNELAEKYVNIVPEQFRVTAADLGVE